MLLEKLKKNLWKIISGFATFLAAVFYVLFQQKKDEAKQNEIEQLKQENAQLNQQKKEDQEKVQILENAIQIEHEEELKNEEILNNCNNSLDGFNNTINILSK